VRAAVDMMNARARVRTTLARAAYESVDVIFREMARSRRPNARARGKQAWNLTGFHRWV
jgi:hypothetical protein